MIIAKEEVDPQIHIEELEATHARVSRSHLNELLDVLSPLSYIQHAISLVLYASLLNLSHYRMALKSIMRLRNANDSCEYEVHL